MSESAFVATARLGDAWVIRSEGVNLQLEGTGRCPLDANLVRSEASKTRAPATQVKLLGFRFSEYPMVGLQEMLLSVVSAVMQISPAANSGFILYAEVQGKNQRIFEFLFHEGGPAIHILSESSPIPFGELGLDYALSNAGFAGVQTLLMTSNTSSKRLPVATHLSKDTARFQKMLATLNNLYEILPLRTTLYYLEETKEQRITVELANLLQKHLKTPMAPAVAHALAIGDKRMSKQKLNAKGQPPVEAHEWRVEAKRPK
jgi:hypothetical protein